jgi:DNA (cytosine-5)-methyltransferase 1
MRHGSLFSGIGGFDLAAQWLGWENVFHCEWNPFGQRVLKHYWPNADSHHDITKTNFTQYANRIDILTGGFPCQPYSSAGKRKGKEDERHLWPEMLRTIREVAPRYVVGENVLGLTNWDGGIVFDEVHTDLELAGYEVAAVVIPAAAVNAPHGRDRVWFVARRVDVGNADNNQRSAVGGVSQGWDTESNGVRNATDANGDGFNQRNGGNEIKSSQGGFDALRDAHAITMHANGTSKPGEYVRQAWEGKFNGSNRGNEFDGFQNFPTQSPICGGNDGVPDQLDGITFSKWRSESIKAYGNAIVPQVALQIFKVIQRIENGETL